MQAVGSDKVCRRRCNDEGTSRSNTIATANRRDRLGPSYLRKSAVLYSGKSGGRARGAVVASNDTGHHDILVRSPTSVSP